MQFYIYLAVLLLASGDVEPDQFKTTVETQRVVIPCAKYPVKPGRDTVSWLKGSKEVDRIDKNRFDTTLQNGSLIINSVKRDDGGWYTCSVRVQDEHGIANRAFKMYLSVNYAPVIFNIRKMVAVFVRDTAVLPCSSRGHPDIAHRWLDGRGNPIRDENKFSVSKNGSLIVYDVQIEDQANYTCAPYNKIGDGMTKSTQLIVKKSPKFMNQLEVNSREVSVDEQGEARLDCLFHGFPMPTITWKRDGKDLTKNIRYKISDDGLLRITNAVVDDTGKYTCYVSSIAGLLERDIGLVVIGKPGTPFKPEVRVTGKTAFVDWTRSSNGGSPQTFEVWVRDVSKLDDYTGWYVTGNHTSSEDKVKPSTPTTKPTPANKYGEEVSIHLDKLIKGFDEKAERSTYFFSIRAHNKKGYSCFSQVVKLVKLARDDVAKGSLIPKYTNPKPLAPYNVSLNITKEGYSLDWKTKVVPGRPVTAFIVIKNRDLNSDSDWKELRRIPVVSDTDCDPVASKQRRRRRRSVQPSEQLSITQDELDTSEVQEFQVLSESRDGTECDPEETDVNMIAVPIMASPEDDDSIIPIVLGSIFALFIILLLISLYCFCRKRKQNRYAARKNERANMVTYTKENGVHTAREEECELTDKAQLLNDDYDSPKHFHLRTCPALKLGQYSTNGNVMNGSNKDQVYILLQRYEEEKELCTCNKRYLTLDSRDQKTKRDKKKGIYKSNSSPDIMLTSDMDGSSIDPSDLLDEERYDLSDDDKDVVGELNNPVRYPTLNRQNFKDSYDQFCRDGSTSKDGRHRLSSEEKTEADKNLDQHDGMMSMKENDLSSENSATESERVLTPKGKELLENNRRSFDGKSSGYGEGSNSTSDSESVHDLKKPSSARNPPYSMGYVSDTGARRDYGYASDISTRSSPLDYKGRPRYQPPSQRHRIGGYEPMPGHYFSEDESVRSGNSSSRPVQPPPYNIALHDIERLSEKNDITDSEEMYDHLLDMGRQLGVTLDDSIESDLNNKVMMPPPRSYSNPRAFPPPPPAVESGYMTDTSLGGKDRYTDREKSERCAQLLNEFKSSTRNNMSGDDYNENDDEETPVQPPTLRSRSVMDNMTFEEPQGPPALKRSNSTGASGVYKEWLV